MVMPFFQYTYYLFASDFIALVYSGTPLKRTPLRPTILSAVAMVSLAQGLVVDHAPPIIAANYDKARLWTTKKIVLMRVLSTDSF